MRSMAGSRVLYWALAFFHLWPIWGSTWFVTIDGPCHLANARILLDLFRGDGFNGQFFALHAWPEPYWTGPMIMAATMAVVPAWLAEKLVFSLAILGLAWSYRRLAVALAPQRPWLSLLAMPFLLHYAVAMGFISFCLSLPLMLMALHRAWEQPLDGSGRMRLALILTVLYFTHLTTFMVAAACVAVLLLFRDRMAGRSGWLGLRTALLAALPGALLTLVYVLLHPTARVSATWVPLADRLAWLLNGRSYNALGVEGEWLASALSAAPVTLLGAALLVIGWRKGPQARVWLILAVCGLLGFLVLPDVAAGGSSASPRALLFFMLLLSLAIAATDALRMPAIAVVIVVVGSDAWHTSLQASTARSLSQEAETMLAAAEPIGDGAVVLPLNYSGNWVHSNLSSYIAATRKAAVLDNFIATAPFSPVQWRQEMLPYAIGNFAISNTPCVEVRRYEQTTGVAVTHVFFWKAPAETADSCLLSTRAQLVEWVRESGSGDAELYRSPAGK
ncbi:MAG: hypothetical protein WAT74_14210 [Flavobacteriales bacterium]